MWVSDLIASAALLQRFTASLLSEIVEIKLYVRFGNIEGNRIGDVSRLPLHSEQQIRLLQGLVSRIRFSLANGSLTRRHLVFFVG